MEIENGQIPVTMLEATLNDTQHNLPTLNIENLPIIALDSLYKGCDKHSRIKCFDESDRCSYVIRGRNQCKNKRVTVDHKFCLRHDPVFLEKERKLSVLPKGSRRSVESKIGRISSSQKRMFNPLISTKVPMSCIGLPNSSWSQVFHNPLQPTHIDIGCARGRLISDLADYYPSRNFIGVEIRPVLVQEAQQAYEVNHNIKNLVFVCANLLNEDHRLELKDSFQKIPVIDRVSILFPDPWVKKKHHCRRVTQPPVIAMICDVLFPGGELILMSDVEDILTGAKAVIEEHFSSKLSLKVSSDDCPIGDDGYFSHNPFQPFVSEREEVCGQLWRRVFKLVFVRSGGL